MADIIEATFNITFQYPLGAVLVSQVKEYVGRRVFGTSFLSESEGYFVCHSFGNGVECQQV
jgi:hypothetical protein